MSVWQIVVEASPVLALAAAIVLLPLLGRENVVDR
jgi:hypothetical protein